MVARITLVNLEQTWSLLNCSGHIHDIDKYHSGIIEEIGLKAADFPQGLSNPAIDITRSTFESYFPESGWTIYHDGRIINRIN